MSAAAILRSRAAALREEARFVTGLRRARLVSKADECDRVAGSFDAVAPSTRIATLMRRGGQPVLGEIGIDS